MFLKSFSRLYRGFIRGLNRPSGETAKVQPEQSFVYPWLTWARSRFMEIARFFRKGHSTQALGAESGVSVAAGSVLFLLPCRAWRTGV